VDFLAGFPSAIHAHPKTFFPGGQSSNTWLAWSCAWNDAGGWVGFRGPPIWRWIESGCVQQQGGAGGSNIFSVPARTCGCAALHRRDGDLCARRLWWLGGRAPARRIRRTWAGPEKPRSNILGPRAFAGKNRRVGRPLKTSKVKFPVAGRSPLTELENFLARPGCGHETACRRNRLAFFCPSAGLSLFGPCLCVAAQPRGAGGTVTHGPKAGTPTPSMQERRLREEVSGWARTHSLRIYLLGHIGGGPLLERGVPHWAILKRMIHSTAPLERDNVRLQNGAVASVRANTSRFRTSACGLHGRSLPSSERLEGSPRAKPAKCRKEN